MRREISQAMELVDDAIVKLTDGFTAIGEQMARGLPEGENARIHSEVAKVVTALQFQDMVEQLLRHALVRLNSLEKTLEHAGALGQPPAQAQARPRAVAQRHMDAGDADLF